MLDQESVSVREIARFVSKTTATTRATPLVPLQYRALQSLMNSVLPSNYTEEVIYTKYKTVHGVADPGQQSRLEMVDRP